jgi:hypothetical protein
LALRMVWFAAQAAALVGGIDMAVSNRVWAGSEFLSATLLVLFAVVAQFVTRLSWLAPMSPARRAGPVRPWVPPGGNYVPVAEAGPATRLYAPGGPVRSDERVYRVAVCPDCGKRVSVGAAMNLEPLVVLLVVFLLVVGVFAMVWGVLR